MSKQTNTQQNNSKGNRTVIVLLVLILVAVLSGAAAGYYFLVYKPAHTDKSISGGKREATALQGSLQTMSEEEIQEALNNIIEEGMFRISIASTIVAEEDGMAEVRIENNIQNRYVMQVSLYLKDTGEEIYTTDLIDPGYYIQSTKFDKHLDPGEYEATAVFSALYADTEELVGTAGAEVKIRVFKAGTTPTPSPLPTVTPTAEPEADATSTPEADATLAPEADADTSPETGAASGASGLQLSSLAHAPSAAFSTTASACFTEAGL